LEIEQMNSRSGLTPILEHDLLLYTKNVLPESSFNAIIRVDTAPDAAAAIAACAAAAAAAAVGTVDAGAAVVVRAVEVVVVVDVEVLNGLSDTGAAIVVAPVEPIVVVVVEAAAVFVSSDRGVTFKIIVFSDSAACVMIAPTSYVRKQTPST
jgi:hypothetical protein